jgi:hypothetical protein
MEQVAEWKVTWWRGPLARFPLIDEPDPPGWQIFLPERFETEQDALARAAEKIETGYRAKITAPDGEHREIRRRL